MSAKGGKSFHENRDVSSCDASASPAPDADSSLQAQPPLAGACCRPLPGCRTGGFPWPSSRPRPPATDRTAERTACSTWRRAASTAALPSSLRVAAAGSVRTTAGTLCEGKSRARDHALEGSGVQSCGLRLRGSWGLCGAQESLGGARGKGGVVWPNKSVLSSREGRGTRTSDTGRRTALETVDRTRRNILRRWDLGDTALSAAMRSCSACSSSRA